MPTTWIMQHNMPLAFIQGFYQAVQNRHDDALMVGYLFEDKSVSTPDFDPAILTTKAFTRSGTGLLRMLHAKQAENTLTELEAWILSGYYYHPQHFDQSHTMQLNLPMLNQYAQVVPLAELMSLQFDQPVFVKPASDLKGFTASVLPAHTPFNQHMRQLSRFANLPNETCIISPVQTLASECRFFVVDKEVITGSYYRLNDQPYKGAPSTEYLRVAHEFAKLFQPAEAFTLDVCLTSDHQFKIVEYNCINCSGTYDANLPLLLEALACHRQSKPTP